MREETMAPSELGLRIAALGHNPASFSRLMTALGDPRSETLIQRNLSNYLNGTIRVPAELIVVLTLLGRHPSDAKAVKPKRQGRPVMTAKERLQKRQERLLAASLVP